MASFEERLATLEGKSLPAIKMRGDLYEDYLRISLSVGEAEDELRTARVVEVDVHKQLKLVRETYECEEAAMLATDPRAVGKNDTERKRNAAKLIHDERKKDGKLHGYWMTLVESEREYESAIAAKDSCVDRFSAARYILRMASGLAHSLGV